MLNHNPVSLLPLFIIQRFREMGGHSKFVRPSDITISGAERSSQNDRRKFLELLLLPHPPERLQPRSKRNLKIDHHELGQGMAVAVGIFALATQISNCLL